MFECKLKALFSCVCQQIKIFIIFPFAKWTALYMRTAILQDYSIQILHVVSNNHQSIFIKNWVDKRQWRSSLVLYVVMIRCAYGKYSLLSRICVTEMHVFFNLHPYSNVI